MKLTDTHCHLNFDTFKNDLSAVLERAWEYGLEFILIPGIDIVTSQQAISLAETDHRIFAAVGIHPNSATSWTNSTLQQLDGLAKHPKVLAVGEVGLDYYRNTSPHQQQMQVLNAQLKLASDNGLPVIIHNRQADDVIFPILLDWWAKQPSDYSKKHSPGVLHSFFSDHPLNSELVKANFFFGISGPITFPNGQKQAEVVTALPLNNLLIETDAPFLTPHPNRGKRNEPGYTRFIVEKIASLKSLPPEKIANETYNNAEKLFSWSNHL